MIAGTLLLTLAGLLVTGGAVGVVAAVRGERVFPDRSAVAGRVCRARLTARHGAAVGVGLVVLLLTGWPVAAIGAAAAVVFVPTLLGGGKEAKRVIAKSEGLADWTRRLADLIGSGAASSTRDALMKSRGSVSDAVAAPVDTLVSRMGPQGFETALRRFAADLRDPAADKIAGVLILRDRNGGPGLADVLSALAADLDERVRMVREIEAERAKPRANMRTIIVVTGLLVVGMMLFARTFLSPYSTALGQGMLVLVVGAFACALRWMRRLSDPLTTTPVLVDPVEHTAAGVP